MLMLKQCAALPGNRNNHPLLVNIQHYVLQRRAQE